MNTICIYYVTFPDYETSEKISHQIVSERLAACTNCFPIKSFYHWKEKMEHDDEWVVLFKTTKELGKSLSSRIEQIHPYDIPCILHIEVSSEAAYFNWIKSEVKASN